METKETSKTTSLWTANTALLASTRATKLHMDNVFWLNKQTTDAIWKKTEFLPQASQMFEPYFSRKEKPFNARSKLHFSPLLKVISKTEKNPN